MARRRKRRNGVVQHLMPRVICFDEPDVWNPDAEALGLDIPGLTRHTIYTDDGKISVTVSRRDYGKCNS